jgi:hypothetical protein
MPQLIAAALTWLVISCSPMMLPDMVPVIAQSTTPPRTFSTIAAKGMTTGTPPSASTKLACVGPDARTRRPRRSASDWNGRTQKTTCAG